MKPDAPSTIYLKNYKKPAFTVQKTQLEFELFEDYTLVRSQLDMLKTDSSTSELVLDGQDLELLKVQLDGTTLDESRYTVTSDTLTLSQAPEKFTLVTECKLYPSKNTSLEGLYRSRTMYCTQCEAEGFRKITYYLDRPDVLSEFTTKITAHKKDFPVLLSNGNLVGEGEAEDDNSAAGPRHWKQWHDPFPKPSYLFALVAGNLEVVEDEFTTCSGREVALKLYVEEKDLDKCDHALTSLKNAMRWDEQVYGREYDLDIFMIVAVDDFNMGAMENKGLNIFNTSCVLANPKTTTDGGFERVEAVVAHEYFHNWSGNRVTCRDWFQLSLKEGFTVYRDAQFSADMNSATVKRVSDVQLLRAYQFAEDAGPMAHPVRPASFMEISNFYTLTVYEKGAEVVRMLSTLLGPEQFRRACDLYFERHDGQAVTIEDFVAAMSDVSGRDFTQFMNWYNQAGTPVVEVRSSYDEEAQEFTLKLSQHCPSTPEAHESEKSPFLIPITMGLLGEQGPLPLWLAEREAPEPGESCVLELTEAHQEFRFKDLSERPTASLLRGFSAPVKLNWRRDITDLQRVINLDVDGFARWDAVQELAIQAIAGVNFPSNYALQALLNSFKQLLEDQSLDPAMVALMVQLPAEGYLLELTQDWDVDATVSSRQAVEETIAESLQESWLATYRRCQHALADLGSVVDAKAMALRSLKNSALNYLMCVENDLYQSLCVEQFKHAENMTDEIAAFRNVVHCDFAVIQEQKQSLIDKFYERWQEESLVVNQWLAVQASSPCKNQLERVLALLEHNCFDIKNPNKARSVIGAFAGNLRHFHRADGSGYKFLADQILRLNEINPQIAARLLTPLTKWRRLDQPRSQAMRDQLERIRSHGSLAKDVYEIVEKSLQESLS